MNKFQSLLAGGIIVASTVVGGMASAATFSFGTVTTNSAGAAVSVDVAIDPGQTILTGFDLVTQGDFSYNPTEYVDISIDGFSIGRIFDGNTANDPFDIANDEGADFGSNFGANTGGQPFSTSATLNLDISSVAGDGVLTILFDTGSGTNFAGTGTGVFAGSSFFAAFQGSLTTAASPTLTNTSLVPVPVPAAGLLLLTAFGALGAMSRQKKS